MSSTDSTQSQEPTNPDAATSPATSLGADVAQIVLAVVIGVLSALALVLFEGSVHAIEHVAWDWLPEQLEIVDVTQWWALAVLTVAGLIVGLIIHLAPGHAGHDPASSGLMEEPMPVSVLPGLLLAAVVSLAAGVSLGPEAPLLGASSALLAWTASRRGLPAQGPVALGMAGLLGAMFGAPVGAAFAFAEMVPMAGRQLYDRMVPLLAASTSGAITLILIAGRPRFAAPFPEMRHLIAGDLASAALIAILGAAVGLAIGWLIRTVHPLIATVNPVVRLTIGGAVLGGIVMLAGERVLFSGQREIGPLIADAAELGNGELAWLTIAKLASLVIAVCVGFRGGRIFPAIFIGMSLGALVHGLVPEVPLALAAGAATVGVVVAMIRLWLLTLLMVAMIVGIPLLPVLGVALIVAHLTVRNHPEPVSTVGAHASTHETS
jgi:H+/Cl- antiporter ClcA